MNTTYELCGKRIRSRIGLPSGVSATTPPRIELLAKLLPIGFIIGKTTTYLPKDGHQPPVYVQFKPNPFSAMNAIGLKNIGSPVTAEQLAQIKIPRDFALIYSVAGVTPEDFVAAAKPLLPYVHGVEPNISCSHDKKLGYVIGQDIDLVLQIIEALLEQAKPLFLKLSPRMDIKEIVRATRYTGIAGYSLINTLGPKPFLIDGEPVLTNGEGSISGAEITELALDCILEARRNTELPIIGGGGFSTGEHALRALDNGANLVAIGTANTGMSTITMARYYPALLGDVENGTDEAGKILREVAKTLGPSMEYRKIQVAEKRMLAEDLFILRFTRRFDARPWQFVFIRIPRLGERPFSILDNSPFSLLIKIRGGCTKFLSEMNAGDTVWVRGPYGNDPHIEGKVLLVGGGTGGASLAMFAKEHTTRTVAVLGAKDRAHLYDEPFKPHCDSVYSFVENDGIENYGYHGYGYHGKVTDYLSNIIRTEQPDFCLNCGPMEMVRRAIEIEERFLPEKQVLSAVEFHTACGVGICGQDSTPSGWSSCVDGPFLTKSQLGL